MPLSLSHFPGYKTESGPKHKSKTGFRSTYLQQPPNPMCKINVWNERTRKSWAAKLQLCLGPRGTLLWALAMVLNPQATGWTATRGEGLSPWEAAGTPCLVSLPLSGKPNDNTRVYFQLLRPQQVGKGSKGPESVCAFKSKTQI